MFPRPRVWSRRSDEVFFIILVAGSKPLSGGRRSTRLGWPEVHQLTEDHVGVLTLIKAFIAEKYEDKNALVTFSRKFCSKRASNAISYFTDILHSWSKRQDIIIFTKIKMKKKKKINAYLSHSYSEQVKESSSLTSSLLVSLLVEECGLLGFFSLPMLTRSKVLTKVEVFFGVTLLIGELRWALLNLATFSLVKPPLSLP